MPTEEVLTCLSDRKKARGIQMNIILQSAPVLKNVKVACMFTVPGKYMKYVQYLFSDTDIKIYVLCRCKDKDVILVYREGALEGYLNSTEVSAFLAEAGYCLMDINHKLKFLGERMSDYYNNKGEYPHETGVFLGYPLDDVVGFMKFGGKNSKYSGYWQVYSDVEQAKRIFTAYDAAKEKSVTEFFAGKRICDIAC